MAPNKKEFYNIKNFDWSNFAIQKDKIKDA